MKMSVFFLSNNNSKRSKNVYYYAFKKSIQMNTVTSTQICNKLKTLIKKS